MATNTHGRTRRTFTAHFTRDGRRRDDLSEMTHTFYFAKARKPHLCCSCGEAIEAGERYLSDSNAGIFVIHDSCGAIPDEVH